MKRLRAELRGAFWRLRAEALEIEITTVGCIFVVSRFENGCYSTMPFFKNLNIGRSSARTSIVVILAC